GLALRARGLAFDRRDVALVGPIGRAVRALDAVAHPLAELAVADPEDLAALAHALAAARDRDARALRQRSLGVGGRWLGRRGRLRLRADVRGVDPVGLSVVAPQAVAYARA